MSEKQLKNQGLTMLFDDSCFKPFPREFNNTPPYIDECIDIDGILCKWNSTGAKMEYDWAKKHYVRCLLLKPFLEGKEVEI